MPFVQVIFYFLTYFCFKRRELLLFCSRFLAHFLLLEHSFEEDVAFGGR